MEGKLCGLIHIKTGKGEGGGLLNGKRLEKGYLSLKAFYVGIFVPARLFRSTFLRTGVS